MGCSITIHKRKKVGFRILDTVAAATPLQRHQLLLIFVRSAVDNFPSLVSPSMELRFVCVSAGKIEPREHMLNEADPLWVRLRDAHFAAASLAITEQLDHFRTVNNAASYKSGAAGDAGESGALDTKAMRRLVNALPQYRHARFAWRLACHC